MVIDFLFITLGYLILNRVGISVVMVKEENLSLRLATISDLESIYNLIYGLSCFEKRPQDMTANISDLSTSLFKNKEAHVYLIEYLEESSPIGYILYYPVFGSFSCSRGVHLEDFYLVEKYRGKGIGKWAFLKFSKILKEKNYSKIEWSSLSWNKQAIGFYEHLGAKEEKGRTYFEYDI